MSETESGAVRVGYGRYDWHFQPRQPKARDSRTDLVTGPVGAPVTPNVGPPLCGWHRALMYYGPAV